MGLDQYLTRKIYVADVKTLSFVDCGGKIRLSDIKWIDEEVAYWRKANAIHGWFVSLASDENDLLDGIDVTIDHLRELRYTCKAVLADHSKAKDLLPAMDGFFFGGAEYDSWYFDNLQFTVDKIDDIESRLLTEYDYFEYRASW